MRAGNRSYLSLSRTGTVLLVAIPLLLAAAYVSSLHAAGCQGAIGEVLNPHERPGEWRYGPLADIEVVVVWHGTPFDNLVHPNTRCLRAEVLRTDRNGRFEVAGWWRAPSWPYIGDVHSVGYPQVKGYSSPRVVGLNEVAASSDYTAILARGVSPTGLGTGDFDVLGNYGCPRPARDTIPTS